MKMVARILHLFLIKKIIDSARFMASLLSNLVDNLAERIYKIKYKGCNYFSEYENVNDNLIKCNYLSCNKNDINMIDEKFKKIEIIFYKLFNNDINKFTVLQKFSFCCLFYRIYI